MVENYVRRIPLIFGVICLSAGLLAGEEPTTRPATNAVPQGLVNEIQSQFNRPPGRTRAEMIENYVSQMEKAIGLGTKAEAEYPDAPNLHVVRNYMLNAAQFMAAQKKDNASLALVMAISRRIVSSEAPPVAKLDADSNLVRARARPAGGKAPAAEEANKEIRAFVARYAETPAAAAATTRGAVLARMTGNKELQDELADVLEAKYLNAPDVRRLLKQLGRSPDVGKPFQAELPRLDGGKLTLPDDLKGKVVVVDFWAVWCEPCRSSMPHLKTLYAKYKPKGVEFVGISLDSNRKSLTDYIATEKITWIITYTGLGWNDPTVRKYGVGGIPSMWVVGKDGNVVSDNARARLEAVIKKALQ